MAKEKKQKRDIHITPTGVAVFPHLNTPDEYEGKKTYKTALRLSADEAAGLQKLIDEATDAAWEELLPKVKPAARKAMSKYYPYEDEYDRETEEPTGNVLFKFSKNAEFKDKKTGKMIETTVAIVDAKKKPMDENVWGGSALKVAFFMFPFKNDAAKNIGVSLKMQAVQVIDLVTSGGGNAGSVFDEEEGYESDDSDDNGFEEEEGYESEGEEDDGSGDF